MKRSLLGDEPAEPDYIMVKGGLTGFWRAEVHILRGTGGTSLQVNPGGDPRLQPHRGGPKGRPGAAAPPQPSLATREERVRTATSGCSEAS